MASAPSNRLDTALRLTPPKAAGLQAELAAIDLWDHLLGERAGLHPIEIDAGKARFFRRVQVIVDLVALSRDSDCFDVIAN